MIRAQIAVPLLLLMAACATAPATTTVNNSVAAAVIALTSAEKAALIYTSLPACPTAPVCADSVLKAKIKAADNTAYTAVKAAESDASMLAVALTAVQTLSNLIPGATP